MTQMDSIVDSQGEGQSYTKCSTLKMQARVSSEESLQRSQSAPEDAPPHPTMGLYARLSVDTVSL